MREYPYFRGLSVRRGRIVCLGSAFRERPFTPTSDDAAVKRAAFVEILREWAASTAEALTCTKYESARRRNRHWPTRGTLILEFGSWAGALEAAALGSRATPRALARQRACRASIPTTAARISRRSRVR